MMNFSLPWHSDTNHESARSVSSKVLPGVNFSIRAISLAQRIKLNEMVRELTLQNEFLRSGDIAEQVTATLADLLVDRLYLEWALMEVCGLRIDGSPATIDLLIERGPDSLTREIVTAIRDDLALTDNERKN